MDYHLQDASPTFYSFLGKFEARHDVSQFHMEKNMHADALTNLAARAHTKESRTIPMLVIQWPAMKEVELESLVTLMIGETND